MASTRRKSAAIALAFIGVAGLSLASAAQLGVTSGSLGAGSSVVASCDTDGIGTSFTNVYSTSGYNVSGVTLTGVNALCNGLSVKVQLTTNSDGTALGSEVTGTLTVVGGTATVAITPNQSAAAVTGVAVVIYG